MTGTLLVVVAVIGACGIVRGLARTLLRLGLRAAEATTAAGLAEVSARRGDLTGLAERREVLRRARRRRTRDLGFALLWFLWLLLPPFLGVAAYAYAVGAPLWLIAPPRITPPEVSRS